MDLAPKFFLNVTGGAGALYLDRQFPEYNVEVGTVTIKTGAIAGLVLSGLCLLVPSLPGRAVLAELGGGALVFESTQLVESHVMPTLEGWINEKTQQLTSGNGKAANANGTKPPQVQGYSPYYATPVHQNAHRNALKSALQSYWRATPMRAAA